MSLRDYYNTRWQLTQAGGGANYSDQVSQAKIGAVLRAIGEHKHVLDYGCGDGQHASMIHKTCSSDVVGVDISSRAVELARQRNPALVFHVIEDGKPLPFAKESFDVVFAGDMIEHVIDVEGLVKEWNRVMKPGGRLIVTTPYHGFVKNVVIALTCFDRHFNPRGEHIRFFTVRTLRTCLEAAGFRVADIKYRGRIYPLSSGMMVFARKERDAGIPVRVEDGPVAERLGC
ncbi:MAG TPA: class I SAM-dependent methyltransferase [Terriglobia bacterium]|nr:class I SAM-dependent methyltransferase [Terriglobia bacterium]